MATNLKVVEHSPAINETGVFRNETLTITFDAAIEPRTVTWETISVNDSQTFSTVVGDLGVIWESGVVKQVTFTPQINFVANSSYSVYVFGSPNSVLGTNGQELLSTYSWEFTTGTGLYTSTGASGGIPSGTTATPVYTGSLSGIPEASVSGIETFAVYSTDPQNQEPNVDNELSRIRITFTGDVMTDISTMSGYITVEETPVLQ